MSLGRLASLFSTQNSLFVPWRTDVRFISFKLEFE